MSKDFTTTNKQVFYAILEKATGQYLATNGKPRLFLGWRGPAQLLGKGIKGTKETATHKIVEVVVVVNVETKTE